MFSNVELAILKIQDVCQLQTMFYGHHWIPCVWKHNFVFKCWVGHFENPRCLPTANHVLWAPLDSLCLET